MPVATDSVIYKGDTLITKVFLGSTQIYSAIPEGLIIMWSGAVVPDGWFLCDGTNGTPDLRDRFVAGVGSLYNVGDTGGQNDITSVPEHSHTFTGSTSSDGDHTHTVNTNSAGSHSHNTSNPGNHNHNWSNTGSHGHNHFYSNDRANEDDAGSGNDEIFRSTNIGLVTRTTASAGSHNHNVSNTGGHNHNYSSEGAHSHTFTLVSNGDHVHTMSLSASSEGTTVDIRPPYYALAFVQKAA